MVRIDGREGGACMVAVAVGGEGAEGEGGVCLCVEFVLCLLFVKCDDEK